MAARIHSLRSLTGASTVTRAFLKSQVQTKNSILLASRSARPAFAIQQPFRRTIVTDLEHNEMVQDQSRGTSTEGESEWKKRAPYKIHESNEDFPVKYEASCHCGKVKYQLKREEPLDSKLCHCTTCQTQHGKWSPASFRILRLHDLTILTAAPFQWAAIFHKDDINFSHGHHNLEWYDPTDKSIEHKLPCKVRCNYCHSPIMDEGRNMILLFPSLIHLKTDEDKAFFKPR